MHESVCLLGGDGSLWGFGLRSQGYELNEEKLRKIDRPDLCKNPKKIFHAKFCRYYLTEDNRLFFTGQNRKYMVGS